MQHFNFLCRIVLLKLQALGTLISEGQVLWQNVNKHWISFPHSYECALHFNEVNANKMAKTSISYSYVLSWLGFNYTYVIQMKVRNEFSFGGFHAMRKITNIWDVSVLKSTYHFTMLKLSQQLILDV